MSVSRAFDDTELARWLTDGYVVLEPEQLDDADHRFFHKRATDLYALSKATASPTTHLDHLGDNLRAMIPEIDAVLTDPVVEGALTRLLGPDYLLHPHSFCHRSSVRDQPFHQDGNLPWNERGHARAHRPDWAMLFYYPQDVDEFNGPTEVVPGSQYWTVDHETEDGGWHPGDRIDRTLDDAILADDDFEERDRVQREGLGRGLGVPDLERRFVHLRSGSVVLAHYDLIHRGSRTERPEDDRFMYKFYFARVRPPTAEPGAARAFPTSALERARSEIRPAVTASWEWMHGLRPSVDELAGTVDDESALLEDGREDERVAAAYRLGRLVNAGQDDAPVVVEALAALESGLHSKAEGTRRAAGHGLRQAGQRGVEVLLRGTRSDRPQVRRPAVAGLGTTEAAASPGVVDAVIDLVANDPDDLVRSNAAYALGQMARRPGADGNGIARALLERLEPGAEPDNATNVGLTRSTVRQSAAYALVQVLANHQIDDLSISRLVDGPLQDRDRYVQGLIVEALARLEHLPRSARQRLVSHLAGRRWNITPEAASV